MLLHAGPGTQHAVWADDLRCLAVADGPPARRDTHDSPNPIARDAERRRLSRPELEGAQLSRMFVDPAAPNSEEIRSLGDGQQHRQGVQVGHPFRSAHARSWRLRVHAEHRDPGCGLSCGARDARIRFRHRSLSASDRRPRPRPRRAGPEYMRPGSSCRSSRRCVRLGEGSHLRYKRRELRIWPLRIASTRLILRSRSERHSRNRVRGCRHRGAAARPGTRARGQPWTSSLNLATASHRTPAAPGWSCAPRSRSTGSPRSPPHWPSAGSNAAWTRTATRSRPGSRSPNAGDPHLSAEHALLL